MEEVIGENMLTFIAPEDQHRMSDAFQKTLEMGGIKDAECLAVKKDGTTFSAEFSASLVVDASGRPQAVIAIGKDITAHKQVERLLQEAKDNPAHQVVETTVLLQQTTEWLNELIAHSPTVIYSTRASEDFAVTYISENVSTLLGYEASQFIADVDFWSNHIHPEDKERIFAEAKHISQQERVAFEYRLLNKKGEYRWIRDERMLARNVDGEPSGYVGSFLDIKESKVIERALRESEEMNRVILEASNASVFMIAPGGKILVTNEVAAKRFSKNKSELLGMSIYNIIPPELHASRKAEVELVFRTGKSVVFEDQR